MKAAPVPLIFQDNFNDKCPFPMIFQDIFNDKCPLIRSTRVLGLIVETNAQLKESTLEIYSVKGKVWSAFSGKQEMF